MEKALKTYRVQVGRGTKKGMEVMHDFVVNSVDQQHELQKAYVKRYAGFMVNIVPVDTVEVVKFGDDAEVQKIEEDSNVKYVEPGEYSGGYYRATIYGKDIPKWSKMKKEMSEAHKSVEKATKDFKEYVEAEFGLNGVEQFSINYDHVTFRFNHVAFDFKAKHAEK